MEVATTVPTQLARIPLDPGRFWIRYAPRRWPSPDCFWLHLAAAQLGPAGMRVASEWVAIADRPDDVLYLPPTCGQFLDRRDHLARELAEQGVPTLAQVLPGERKPPQGGAVLDLTPILLAREPLHLPRMALPDMAVWPLIDGISDQSELVSKLAPELVDAGVRVVTVMRPELSAREKRELAEGRPESVFDALFHHEPHSDKPLARALASHGLRAFAPRPKAAGLPAFQLRRRLAGLLAEAAELDLRCDRYGRGQELYRAARYLEDCSIDMLALHREGNLHVLRWLDPVSRSLLENALSGADDCLEEYRAAYLGRQSTPQNAGGKE